MKSKQHVGRLSQEDSLRIERSISRDLEISQGLRQCHHRVHRSAKSYTRKTKHKHNYD